MPPFKDPYSRISPSFVVLMALSGVALMIAFAPRGRKVELAFSSVLPGQRQGQDQEQIKEQVPAKLQVEPSASHFAMGILAPDASDYWKIVRAGAKKAEQQLGVQVDFRLPAQRLSMTDSADFIYSGINEKKERAIISFPPDSLQDKGYEDDSRYEAFAFGNTSDHNNFKNSYVATCNDNKGLGRQAGRELIKALPSGGEVMVFAGDANAPIAAARLEGLKEGVQGTAIRLIDVREDDYNVGKAIDNVREVLHVHPGLAGCVGLGKHDGAAIASALREEDRIGQVKVVCFDEDPQMLAEIRRGTIDATIVQNPFEFGYHTVINTITYFKSDHSVKLTKRCENVPPRVVNRKNVAKFQRQWNEYLVQSAR